METSQADNECDVGVRQFMEAHPNPKPVHHRNMCYKLMQCAWCGDVEEDPQPTPELATSDQVSSSTLTPICTRTLNLRI